MLQTSIDFSHYSSVKIGGICPVTLIQNIQECNSLSHYFIVGGANNLLISPSAKNLCKLDKSFDYITHSTLEEIYHKYSPTVLSPLPLNTPCIEIGAASSASRVFHYAKKHNLGGFELLSHLPGSMGGLIKMNAGLKEYEIKDILVGIITNNGFIPTKELGLAYRSSKIHGIIFAGVFRALGNFNPFWVESFKSMRKNQPKGASFGSCFKNPPNAFAGKLLEEVGLRGERFKNVGFSKEHANFLINYGGGSFIEAVSLIKLAKKRVYEAFGILLQEEVIIRG